MTVSAWPRPPIFRKNKTDRCAEALRFLGRRVTVTVSPGRSAELTSTVTGELVSVAYASTLGTGTDLIVLRQRIADVVDIAITLAQVADIELAR